MTRATITQKGVFDQKSNELKIGSFVEFKGDKLPRYLEGKAKLPDAVPVMNVEEAVAAMKDAEKAMADAEAVAEKAMADAETAKAGKTAKASLPSLPTGDK